MLLDEHGAALSCCSATEGAAGRPRNKRTDVPYCLPCATCEESSPHRIAMTPNPQILVSQGAHIPTSRAQKRDQFWTRQAGPKTVSPGAPLYCLVLGNASARRQAGSPSGPKNGVGNLTADACFLELQVSRFLDPYWGISGSVNAIFASSISYFTCSRDGEDGRTRQTGGPKVTAD